MGAASSRGLEIQQDGFGDRPDHDVRQALATMMARLENRMGRDLARDGLLAEMMTIIAEQAMQINELARRVSDLDDPLRHGET